MGTIVITGSASGIGAATGRLLERQGHHVIGIDLRDAAIEVDLSQPDGRASAVVEAMRLAPDGIDGCVAGAGIGPQFKPVEQILSVNYFGAVEVLDGLREALAERSGTAVAICSNSAGIIPVEDPTVLDAMAAGDEPSARTLAADLHGAICYGASKLALGRALRHRAEAWGEAGVRLNAVAPGPVTTPLLQGSIDDPELGPSVDALPVPWGPHQAAPEQMASIISFLLSEASAPVHGSILFADGGTDAMLRPDHV
jgi:NAD(P)-dependent dehydrogenase (short-subunit alcohol dehydrogenase family)